MWQYISLLIEWGAFLVLMGEYVSCDFVLIFFFFLMSPWGSEWIISVEDYVDNSSTALGSSDPREVRLKL